MKIADDDAAAAVIANPLHARTAGAREGDRNAGALFSLRLPMKDSMAGAREKLAKLRQLAEEVASSRFSAEGLARDMETHAEQITSDAEGSGYSVHSDVSELLAALRDEIQAINSFEGFLLGVHDKIEKFTEQAEFGLEQILDIEQNMSKRNSTLEIGKFSLVRIHMERLKALRGQGNLESERVLRLLKDDVASPGTVQQVVARIAVPPEQHVSTQDSGQG
jgi:hypothetical protein